MPRDGSATRTAILDAAERLTLERGFAGAPLDRILEASGSTKGAFFHHFASKQALADALVRRWAEGDARLLDEQLDRACRLTDDPVQRVLLLLALFAEQAEAEAAEGSVPGCLFAAYTYQAAQFEPRTLEVLRESMVLWRRRLRLLLDDAAQARPPVVPVDLDVLADAVTVVFEGAFVVARATGEPPVLSRQLWLLRTQVALLFGS